MAKTATYVVFLDNGVRLVMRAERGSGPWLSNYEEDDSVGVPGEVVAVAAVYDLESAENNLRVHRIARAFGVEAVTWDAIPEAVPELPSE